MSLLPPTARNRRAAALLAMLSWLAGCEPPTDADAPSSTAFRDLQPAPSADYLALIPVFWREIYGSGGTTLYCGAMIGSGSSTPRLNLEHVMPMAWVSNALECGDRDACRAKSARFNRIEADMHNLYPARADVNRRRGAMAFAELPGERSAFEGCDFEVDDERRRVEPREAARGPIARAMLYMEATHGIPLYGRQKALMERWDRAHPPEAEEIERHARIVRLQGNENPFVTRWAEKTGTRN